jgi:hypothetical protein
MPVINRWVFRSFVGVKELSATSLPHPIEALALCFPEEEVRHL